MKSLDELRLFEHLARTSHYGRSSAECHVSQPTLSRTISRMESELGVRLFDRDRRSVNLTLDGIRFREFAQQVLTSWQNYLDQTSTSGPVAGPLSVFCTVTAAQSILPDVLGRFRDSHPAVHLVLETGYAAEALQKLEEGVVDVTVAPLPPRPPKHLVTHVIATTPLVLVTQRGGPHRLPRRPSAAWSQVPFVLPTASLVRSLADRWFRHLRVRPTIVAEEAGHEALLSLVTLGVGIGVVPELVATGSPLSSRVEIVETTVPPPHFDIAVCTTPERVRARQVAAFWDTLVAAS